MTQMPTFPDLDLDGLISPSEAGSLIKKATGTLANMRTAGTGPQYIKLGNRVFYTRRFLLEYREENTFRSTSEHPHVRAECSTPRTSMPLISSPSGVGEVRNG